MIVVAFLALAHSSYFTMIFLVAEEPYLFSLVAYTCLGAYVIMLCFLCVLGGMWSRPTSSWHACVESSGQP